MNPYDKIIELLESNNVWFEKMEHEPVYTSEQAAAVRGMDLESGAKALLFKFENPSRPTHLSGVQGAGEQRTELYGNGTAKEQPQPATPQSAKSTSGAAGSASRQAGAVRGSGFVLVVVGGNKKVDWKKLKETLQVKKVRMATPEEVVAQMGVEIGACYPFGNVAGLRTLADKSLAEQNIISCNPGRHDISIKFKFSDFAKLVNPEIVDVT